MKRTHWFALRVIAASVLLALAVACTKSPNDAQMTADIQSKLGADSGLQNKQIDVKADKGTVTLSGAVENDAQREAAARYASTEPGVKQVINNLQVGTATAAASVPAQQAPDTAQSAPEPAPAPSNSGRPSPSPRKRHHQAQSSDQVAQNTPPPQTAPAPQQAPAPAPQAAAAPPPPPEPQKVTLPSGTSLAVRLVDSIDSATAQTGDQFHASLDVPVSIEGDVVIPAHYDVEGHVVNAQSSGKFQGRALLELQLDRVKVGDRWYNVDTDHFKQQTGSRGKNTAEKVGAGAVAGAILGGIFGGGKGAAIGSVAGAGAGGGVQAASKKPDIKLSSERVLTFTLQSPVTIVPTTKPARGGQKLETSSDQQ
jgi:outer membrane biosynthesis protein TonB